MKLIDVVKETYPRRLVMPLMGFPGTQLTRSTIWQNEFNHGVQFRTIRALVKRFEPDAAFFMMDLAVEAGAIGLPVEFPLHASPTVAAHPVQVEADLAQFKVVNPLCDARVYTYVETMRQMRRTLDVLRGAYITGPFTLAGLMMGASELAMATVDQPGLVHAVTAFATDVVLSYGQALVKAGADLVCILEPTASFVSPRAFREFSGQYVTRIVDALPAMTILHVCGNTKHLVPAMCETGVQGLNLDAPMDMVGTLQRVPEDIVLIGNVDPVRVMTQAKPEEVSQVVTSLLDALRPYPNFVLSTGCDLPPETPLENIAAFMAAGRRMN